MLYYKGIPWTILGLLIYSLAPLLMSIVGLSGQFALLLQLPALAIILISILRSSNSGKNMYRIRCMNFLFAFYMLLCLIMYLRGYSLLERDSTLNLNGILYLAFGGGTYILWALMPLFVLKSYPYFKLRPIVIAGTWIGFAVSIYTITQIPSLMQSSLALSLGLTDDDTGFSYARIGEIFAPLMMCLMYVSKRQKRLLLITFAINIIVCVFMARRGALAMNILLIAFMLIQVYPRMNGNKRFATIFLIVVFSLISIYQISGSSMFRYINERGFEDTRAGVNEELLNQMTDFEKFYGKGLNGKYYMPIRKDDFFEGWRYGCETGFLNIVLKGGYLMAFVYIFLLLVPAVKGIFHSSNQFCKGGGFYILWTLIYLYPFGILDFNISFFFVWMWVMLCSMPSVRNMTDAEIKMKFFS